MKIFIKKNLSRNTRKKNAFYDFAKTDQKTVAFFGLLNAFKLLLYIFSKNLLFASST